LLRGLVVAAEAIMPAPRAAGAGGTPVDRGRLHDQLPQGRLIWSGFGRRPDPGSWVRLQLYFQPSVAELAGLDHLRLGGPPGADWADAGELQDGVAVVPERPGMGRLIP
jgi:hypothetical protein